MQLFAAQYRALEVYSIILRDIVRVYNNVQVQEQGLLF